MARGSEAKQQIIQKLLSTFEGSFLYNGGKEVRIPVMENGELVQIKVALTAAKVNVECGADMAVPTASSAATPVTDGASHLTDAEKQETKDLLTSLNL